MRIKRAHVSAFIGVLDPIFFGDQIQTNKIHNGLYGSKSKFPPTNAFP